MKRLPFDILYEDRDLIAIDKPAGLLTTHTKLVGRAARESQATAENFLNDYLRKGQLRSRLRVWLVHRLDRETSGVMVFAKSEAVAEAIRAHWNEITEKTYRARVEGVLEEESGVFESWLREDDDGYRVRSVKPGTPGAKLARTEWRRLAVLKNATEVEVKLKSGRKNQIRVHFSEAGHPVCGDVKYGAGRAGLCPGRHGGRPSRDCGRHGGRPSRDCGRHGGRPSPLCLRSVELKLKTPRGWKTFAPKKLCASASPRETDLPRS